VLAPATGQCVDLVRRRLIEDQSYAGRRLEVRLGATTVTVYDGAAISTEHARECQVGCESGVFRSRVGLSG
jgi:hypothetical protein